MSNLTHKEYLQLIIEVNRLRNEVHLFNVEEISEAALDDLKHKISVYEQANPDKISPNSPNYTISGGVSEGFEKYTHKRRMLSLTDVFSFDELQDWENRWVDFAQKEGVTLDGRGGANGTPSKHNAQVDEILKQVQDDKGLNSSFPPSKGVEGVSHSDGGYICEPKLDGMAISLHYDDGELVTAVTRGDGYIGENVTENVKQIKNIPKKIEYTGKIEVRGEVFMTKKDFFQLNEEIKSGKKVGKMGQKGENATFANSRNAAAGTIRQLDSRIVAQRNLSFVAYNLYID